jgi:hypothetical protein
MRNQLKFLCRAILKRQNSDFSNIYFGLLPFKLKVGIILAIIINGCIASINEAR